MKSFPHFIAGSAKIFASESLVWALILAFMITVGAMAYAMYCPIDSAAFVVTWYAVAIGLCAAIGALVGSILLRW